MSADARAAQPENAGAWPRRFAFLRRAWVLFLLLWVVLVGHAALRITFKLEPWRVPYVVGTDSNCYYAFAHSLYFDRDVNFLNQYAFIVRTQPEWQAVQFRQFLSQNPERGENPFPAGTGLVAIPFLVMTHLIVLLLGAIGIVQAVSPFAPVYVLAFYAAQITYGVGALWIGFRLLSRFFGGWSASLGVAATVLCGPMIYYLLYDQGMPHLAGAFFGTLTLFGWVKWNESVTARKAGMWAVITGLSCGIAVIVRPYNLPLGVLLVEPLARVVWRCRRDELRPIALMTILAIAGAGLGVLPQLLVWKAQYGTWIANQQGHSFSIMPPHALQVLFSRRHGLFFWSPAYLVAIAGVAIALRGGAARGQTRMSARRVAVVLLLIFAGALWMMGNWRVWWLGVSFGMRGFIDFSYIFAFGFAYLTGVVTARYPRRARLIAIELMLLFTLVNLHLMTAWRSGIVFVDGPLYWRESVFDPDRYGATLRRDWAALTHFSPAYRASLFGPQE
jgi:hypothetical protein